MPESNPSPSRPPSPDARSPGTPQELPDASADDSLDEIVARYLSASARGEPLDRDALLATHPELREALEEFFHAEDALIRLERRIAEGVRRMLGTTFSRPLDFGVRVGEFVIIEEIGRGATGVVYRALDPSLQREVALKVFFPERVRRASRRKRIRAEAEAAAALEHEAIVPVYGIGEDHGVSFIAMRRIEGETLAECKERYRERWREIALVIEQVARAVAFAHSHNIVHRDLKPGNILVDLEGRPWVTDFGHAKLLDDEDPSLSDSGLVLGTPRYLAPEQLANRGSSVDGVSIDIHALGAILYDLLAQRPAFDGASTFEILERIRDHVPAAPSRFQPGVPRDLETICLRALDKDPARRYESAGALADDLARYLENRPILARRSSMPERVLKSIRRRPAVAWAIATTMLAIAGFGVWLVPGIGRRDLDERVARLKYAYDMDLAGKLVEGGNPDKARRLVDDLERRFRLGERGLEWKLVLARLGAGAPALNELRHVAFGERGALAGTSASGELWVRSARSSDVHSLGPIPGTILDARFSVDDARLVVVTDRLIAEYSLEGGEPRTLRTRAIESLGIGAPPTRDGKASRVLARVSSDSSRLVLVWPTQRIIHVVEIESGALLFSRSDPYGLRAFTLHGSMILGRTEAPRRRRATPPPPVWVWVSLESEGGGSGVIHGTIGAEDAVLSPKRDRIAVAFRAPRTIEILSFPSGESLRDPVLVPPVRDLPFQFLALAWHPDGESIAFALQDGRVFIESLGLGSEARATRRFESGQGSRYDPQRVRATLTFDASGRWLASSRDDYGLRIYDAQAVPWIDHNALGGPVWDLVVTENRRILGASDAGDVVFLAYEAHPMGVNVRRLASARLDPRRSATYYALSRRANRMLWEWDYDGTIEVRGVELVGESIQAPIEATLSHGERVYAAEFFPDGDALVVSYGKVGAVAVWRRSEAPDRSVVWSQEAAFNTDAGRIRSIAVSPRGELIALGMLDRELVWLVRPTGEIDRELPVLGTVASLAFDEGGRRLAVGTRSGHAHVFDVDRRQEVAHSDVHGGQPVWALAFGPRNRLFTAGHDGRVSIWEVVSARGEAGSTLARLLDVLLPQKDEPPVSIAIGADGRVLVVGGGRPDGWGKISVLAGSSSERP